MEYKLRSIESLLSDIDDDFQLTNTDWFYKAIGWIARGLEIMKLGDMYIPTTKPIIITDYKGVLPCNLDYLMFFTDGCNYLPINTKFSCANVCECPSGYTSGPSVTVNPSFIQTNYMQTGEVIAHYYSMPTDENGYPMIIDSAEVTEALGWYVVYKMITNGYKHKVIKDYKEAKAYWEQSYPRAQNAINYPSIRKIQNMTDVWNNIAINNNLLTTFFN